jgi:hypothetical protein
MSKKRIFILADHGLAVIYFLQSEVVSTLLANGCEVVLLTDESLFQQIQDRFAAPGLFIEGLRYQACQEYSKKDHMTLQWWAGVVRRVGTSKRINTEAMDSYIRQVEYEVQGRQRLALPLIRAAIWLLRNSRPARKALVNWQMRFSPSIYTDLFEKYKPDLVVSCTYGWRNDRYLLREAVRRGIKTGAVIVGWDNPSSYGIPAAPLDFITCWSELQKQELVIGSDWEPAQVNVGGIPSYDGYFRGNWLLSREEYFRLHKLDPARKLISYACSFITFSPNYRNVETLARLVASDQLAEPSQLLIRLHPNHFMHDPLFSGERERIQKLARELPHVHVVEPVPLGGNFGYYSGEDMPEKSSMMAHSDIFTTVYSTMVVETAIHNRPIISVCLDVPGGWNAYGKFSLKLSEIGNWPTHERFLRSSAGRVALNEDELRFHLNRYLKAPDADSETRGQFIRDEVTYSDGNAGRRTGEYLLSLVSDPANKKGQV